MSTAHQALAALPQPLQQMLREHAHGGEIERDELLQELHLQILQDAQRAERATLAQIFSRARARVRGFTQDLARAGAQELDEQQIDDGQRLQVKQGPRAAARDATAAVAAHFKKSERQARRIIAAQKNRPGEQGDFFGAGA